MSRSRFGVAVICLIALTSSPLYAAPVFYTNAGTFAGAVGAYAMQTENLDTTPLGFLPQVTPTGITISSTNAADQIFGHVYSPPGPSPFPYNERSISSNTLQGGTSVTFDFSTPVNAFGIDIFDLGTTGSTDLTITTDTGSQLVFDDFFGGIGNQLFAGVVDSATAFSSVTISNTRINDFVEYDNIQFGGDDVTPPNPTPVPEPTSLALWGLGILGAGYAARRRRKLSA